VAVNHELVGAYLGAAAALKKEFRLRGAIPIETVMTLPGAVAIRTEGTAANGLAGVLAGEALDRALAAYDSMRLEEGRRLVAALRGHFAAIEADVGSIESEARGLPEAYARRLRERVESLVRERGLDDLRLAQEVALLADRVDLTEELVRLRGYPRAGARGPRSPGGTGRQDARFRHAGDEPRGEHHLLQGRGVVDLPGGASGQVRGGEDPRAGAESRVSGEGVVTRGSLR